MLLGKVLVLKPKKVIVLLTNTFFDFLLLTEGKVQNLWRLICVYSILYMHIYTYIYIIYMCVLYMYVYIL